jgi:hypothetical protein
MQGQRVLILSSAPSVPAIFPHPAETLYFPAQQAEKTSRKDA